MVSNARLREWLEGLRGDLATESGQEVPRPGRSDGEAPAEQTAAQLRVQAVADRLSAGVPADPIDRTNDQQARWLLAQLLSWHRREDKSTWWEFFRLMDLNDDQLVEESAPLGGLIPVGPLGDVSRGKWIWRYRYPPQDHEIGRGSEVYDPTSASRAPSDGSFPAAAGNVFAIDLAERTVDIRRSADPDAAHPTALVPLTVYRTPEQQEALLRIGEWVAAHGSDAVGPYRAGRDLLLRRPPRVGIGAGAQLRDSAETGLAAARRLALALDETTLAIQGPPGSGKTFTGAHMICSLLAAGKKVGIAATSHKVIANLLTAVCRAASQEGVEVRAIQRVNEKDLVLEHDWVAHGKSNNAVLDALASGEANLAAGTAWLWSPLAMEGAVDVLFVDEAGQISLANALAMSGAAHSVVLLGDPQQLDQPLQGSHPPGADRSALAHLLGDDATMPPERGLFLETTWRLHPDICHFTSESFYDDRLVPEADNIRQRLQGGGIANGTGLRMLEVAHQGNDNESIEEARQIAALAQGLVDGGGSWTDRDGNEHAIGWDQVLVIAPYNAQVGAIARLVPAARVGTVDKFQGQEAPISIYSMATSSPEDAPRGMDFLYSRHRLNVATSRARCVAVVVASPALLRVRARTPEQMRLANALCRFVELARESET